jgi:hypothetical protein
MSARGVSSGDRMLELANVLFGAALSVRFNVFALALATIASVALSICLGLIAGDARISILVSTGLNVIGLHVGYVVCGVALSIMSKCLIRGRQLDAASRDMPTSITPSRGQ